MCSSKHTEDKDYLINYVLLNQQKDLPKDVAERIEFLKRNKVNKPIIYIGTGTCGVVAGSNKTLEAVKTYIIERNIDAEVVEVGCIGYCNSEPLLDIQLPGKARISFEHVYEEKVPEILDGVLNNNIAFDNVLGQFKSKIHSHWENIPFIEDNPFFAIQNRIVLQNCGKIDPCSIEEYIARGGYSAFLKAIHNYTTIEICELIEKSELRGRSGGGFPTGEKWKIANITPSEQKYIICNADESDPGAFMNRLILEGDPFRIIEGLAIAAYGIGATKAIIYTRSNYNQANKKIKNAINKAKEYGLLGHDIFKSGFDLEIILKQSAGAFVCGEETALIGSIESRRGMPVSKPPYPAVKGLNGKPTVVNNLETIANIPMIIEKGPNWFNTIGTNNSKGTKIFAVSGKAQTTGLLEVNMGTKVRDIIFKACGGIKNDKKFKALLIGGPDGGCLIEENLDTIVDYEAMKEAGTTMGAGSMVIVDESSCMVDITKYFFDYFQRESCGKCIPCREGSRRVMEILENTTKRPTKETSFQTLERFKGIMQLENLAEVMKETSLCGLGKNAPNSIIYTLKYFRDEYESHIFDRKCPAGVCNELRIFYIDVEKCTGCGICLKKCPTNAIIGSLKHPHFIVEDKCIGCGNCEEVCKFNAIYIK